MLDKILIFLFHFIWVVGLHGVCPEKFSDKYSYWPLSTQKYKLGLWPVVELCGKGKTITFSTACPTNNM